MEPIIEFKNVSKDYFGRPALKGITFAVTKGSIHALLGPNGAGKSTAMRLLCGLIPITSGEIIKKSKVVGYLPEVPPLYTQLTVIDYLTFVATINGVSKELLHSRVAETISKCSLTDVATRLIRNLSKGYKQRVGIAQAIVSDPEVIILDEPTVGLDPENIIKIRELIKSLEGKYTILLSTHLLHEVDILCSEATFIFNGTILKTGKISEISQDIFKGQKILFELEHWDSLVEEKLKEKFDCEISVEKREYHRVSLLLKNPEIKREEIARFLHQENLIPLSLSQEEASTTEIFKNLILKTGVQN